MPKVLIYGAGAIGSLMACLLSGGQAQDGQPQEEIALLGRSSHMEAISDDGLSFLQSDKREVFRFRHCFISPEELKGSGFCPDLVLITVKTTGLAQVGWEMERSGLLERELKNVPFVLLMNGMGNVERLGIYGHRTIEGITSTGVVHSGPGQIELRGKGKTVIEQGLPDEISGFMLRRFQEKGFILEFALDFQRQQWNKLFVNAVINPITALCGKSNGVVLSPHLRPTVRRLVEECVSAASSAGMVFDPGDVMDTVCSVAEITCNNTSSMLGDVRHGRQTEIDSINGYVTRLAGERGLDVPLNQALCSLVRSLQDNDRDGA